MIDVQAALIVSVMDIGLMITILPHCSRSSTRGNVAIFEAITSRFDREMRRLIIKRAMLYPTSVRSHS
jgi:small neutral amino acid transporter SnatA (MarC family)